MKTIHWSEKAVPNTDAGLAILNETDAKRTDRLDLRASCGRRPRSSRIDRSRPVILVAVDFLPASLKATEYAATLAMRLDASLLLLHVVDPIYTGSLVNLVTKQKIGQEALRRASEKINSVADALTEGSVSVTCAVRVGLPEIEILRLACKLNVNIIVLGRMLRNPLSRWILGSVGDDIIDLAPCPVVVVNSKVATRIPRS